MHKQPQNTLSKLQKNLFPLERPNHLWTLNTSHIQGIEHGEEKPRVTCHEHRNFHRDLQEIL